MSPNGPGPRAPWHDGLRGWHVLALALALLVVWAFGQSPARAADRPTPEAARAHWAFRPLRRLPEPVVQHPAWSCNPIDRFLLAAMETNGLAPASPATPEQILRRVTFDLTGLPPSLAEIDAFVSDASPGAYERLVERLLASPHYGERWARHWLDLARYAESDGFEHDAVRAASWRYRDYVIAAFNENKPYDRFVQEQVAGDELWPDRPEALVATGFNLLGPDMVDSADQVQRRLNTLNDMTDTAASVVLGLTLGCARCHDHKFEPFTQRDYYQLQAFFAPAEFRRELPVPTPQERGVYEAARARYEERTRTTRAALTALEQPYREQLYEQKLARLSEDAQLAHRTPKEKRTKEQEGTVQETAGMVRVTDAEVEAALSAEDRPQRQRLLAELKRVAQPMPLPVAMVLQDTNASAHRTFVLGRGDYNNPREEVGPGIPEVLGAALPARDASTEPRRAALAAWLTHPDNPLTARVMVNRVWQHHFGRGLVATPSDFGVRGAAPSHPELLDWLAAEFIRTGWDFKALHRLILTSAAYRQSTSATAETLTRDPENRWLARQNRQRLEGEAIRDSLLAISGRLNGEAGGPSVLPPIPSDITRTSKNWSPSPQPAEHLRRSIYIFARRNLRFPFLEVFDAPDSNLTCPERGRSTTAPQALTLLNSAEVMDAARITASRVCEAAPSSRGQVELVYRLILGRPPTARELRMTEAFLSEASARSQEAGSAPARLATTPASTHQEEAGGRAASTHPVARAEASLSAIVELCRALFNVNSFVYVD